MANLKTIAAASGVSIRTVARALKNAGYIHPQTRERVESAAKRLGYFPNRAARSLRTAKSYEVVVLASSMDELHVLKIAGLEHTLRPTGFVVNIVFEADAAKPGASNLFEEIVQRRPAAVALFAAAPVLTLPVMRLIQAAMLEGAALEQAVKDTSGKARENLDKALARVERCYIGTIHSFCARLLRERPVEAGVDMAFEEIEDVADAELRQEAWEQYRDGLYATDNPLSPCSAER